ncbi:hypothetical protein E4U22_006353 [Claviceps purpurea]|nr:hypothetical protein E4U28_002314 [Claviceps purpurea]KAG6317294.1 hypothetical protein E4U22_006353 [Claviceps purpurea]
MADAEIFDTDSGVRNPCPWDVIYDLAQCPTSDHGYDNNAFLSALLDDLTVFLWHMFAVEDIHAVPSGWPSIGMPRVRVMQASR